VVSSLQRRLRVRWSELLAGVFIAAVLLPQLAALVVPYEEFPYTSAPMFAHYVGPDTPRYRFRFVAERGDGSAEREIRATDLGLNGVELSRYFLGSIYGSMDPLSPFGHHGGDTPEAFEARLSTFFRDATTVLERRGGAAPGQLSGIRLEVVRLEGGNRDGEVHVVGRYDVASHHFTHTWRGQP